MPPNPTPEPKKEEPKKGVNLPPAPSKLKGTAQEAVLRNWKDQYETGTLYRCKEEGCYYPLNPMLDPSNNVRTRDGKLVMQCSWDRSHGGGEQLVKPKSKKDEIGDTDL